MEHFRPVLLKVVLPFVSSLCFSACVGSATSYADDLGQTLVINVPEHSKRWRYPGTDKHELVNILTQLRDGYLQSNSPFENVRAIGQISYVSTMWKQGARVLSNDTMPPGEWKKFVLTIKGGKKRFEHGFTQQTSAGPVDLTVYRLYDGDSYYKLDGTALVISRPLDPEEQWLANAAFAFYQCEFVRFQTDWCLLPDYLKNLSELIVEQRDVRENRGYFDWSGGALECWRENGQIVFQFDGDRDGILRQLVWIDPEQGFRMVKERVENGRRTDGLYIREERDVSHMEVAPGTYFPHRATIFAATLGKGPEADGGAGWVKREIEISDVAFGDFQVDPSLFDPDSLPIPVGANVSDRRGEKELDFVFAKVPISEQLLANQLSSIPDRESSWRTWLIGANILICILLAALIARRVFVTTSNIAR